MDCFKQANLDQLEIHKALSGVMMCEGGLLFLEVVETAHNSQGWSGLRSGVADQSML